MLSKELGLPHISTGNLYREYLHSDSDLGRLARTCKGYMENGFLIPDDIIYEILAGRIAAKDCERGFILEGYPRTAAQAVVFAEKIKQERSLHIVKLEVPDELLMERLSGRLICPDCQRPYHRTFAAPKEAGVCDDCRGDLVERPDDRPEAARNRLLRYHQRNQEVLDYLAARFPISTIECDNDPQRTFKAILKATCPYPRDYLKSALKGYPYKGVQNFYDVVMIYKDPKLIKHVVETFSRIILEADADYIAAPEARSLPLLGAIANKLEKPALFLRKAGKIPGPTYSIDYTTGYSQERLELGLDEALYGKRVVIIDDGIANGETMLAVIRLLEKAGMKVVCCLAVIEHHYAKRHHEYEQWEPYTITLFDL